MKFNNFILFLVFIFSFSCQPLFAQNTKPVADWVAESPQAAHEHQSLHNGKIKAAAADTPVAHKEKPMAASAAGDTQAHTDAAPKEDKPVAGWATDATAKATTDPKTARRQIMVPQMEAIKGSAGSEIIFVSAEGSCAHGMAGIGVTNQSPTKAIVARLEVQTTYTGHDNKKQNTIDNIAPGEVRYVGCYGCSDQSVFKTCITYKILAAVYKP